ncbi:Elongation factor G [Wickerhamomyces ciferrii]|uniref:Ribosome-releasing factor 2, mitochondrial n=1 Tax=Wickerhamomyces ciferrii (strain ATCC 14091 / BCRC 22168 / CBS 111 / JCM 3599 / NBRC 0793 / NRRL Y-1031 F-60-10) TaxID=1206466 RepID=K0KNK2_WICCF|nr:Elongation factor G [Wickerhamomyces ciferrii]CCH42698.1 Elongation factor G [Wickerhamomyces ciferrii]
MVSVWRQTLVRSFHTSRIIKAPPSYPISKIRNIGIIAHIDAGKTTTTERMLYYSGITSRIGNVDQGDTVTDFLPAERERGITIQSAAITLPWNKHKINLIDTPGHADFGFEVIRSLKVLDGAVTILDAVAGVEAQTEKVWKQSKFIPKLFFINKMDREGAGFSRTVKEIISKLGTRVLLLNVPYFIELENRERKFVGVLDILNKKLLKWNDDESISVLELEGETYDEVVRCRESLVETLGEIDDAVIENFFETEDYMKVSTDVLMKAIKKSTLTNYAVPVLCGASFKNIGVQPLMDAVNHYLPSPLECKPDVNVPVEITKDGAIINKNKNLTVAMAFKVITDPIRGVMVFIRVYSGKLKNHGTVYVNGERFKLGKLLVMHANVPQDVQEISAGNIGVIVSDNLKTGDTILGHAQNKKLQAKESNIVVNPIIVPPPVFSISLEPRTSGDKRSMDEALSVLLREDPSLKLTVDEETGQILLSGMGELHLEIARDRLRDLKAKLEIGQIMVSYKEAVTNKLTISKENKDTGFFITLSLEPLPEELEVDNTKSRVNLGDNNILEVPNEPETWDKVMSYQSCINAFISGSISSIQRGPILKLPLNSTLIKIVSFDLPIDSNNVTQWIQLVRQSILELLQNELNFVALEPVMNVSVEVNGEDIGNVMQDLTSARKGIISGIDDGGDNVELVKFKDISESQYVPMDPTLEFLKTNDGFNGGQTIHAVVPLREMIGYLPKLRSLTQGRATYHMEFKGMSPITSDRLVEITNEF